MLVSETIPEEEEEEEEVENEELNEVETVVIEKPPETDLSP